MSFLKTIQGILPVAFSGKRIAYFTKKDVLRRGKMNELVACLNPLLSTEIRRGSSDLVTITPTKMTIQIKDSGGGSSGSSEPTEIGLFKLVDVADDYVTGTRFDPVSNAEWTVDDYIAKPWKLRCSLTAETKYGSEHHYAYDAGPDSLNKKRTDTWAYNPEPATETEDQLVYPPWVVDEEFAAVRVTVNVVGPASERVHWLMIARPGQWSKIA